jgi:hypothetical protein
MLEAKFLLSSPFARGGGAPNIALKDRNLGLNQIRGCRAGRLGRRSRGQMCGGLGAVAFSIGMDRTMFLEDQMVLV